MNLQTRPKTLNAADVENASQVRKSQNIAYHVLINSQQLSSVSTLRHNISRKKFRNKARCGTSRPFPFSTHVRFAVGYSKRRNCLKNIINLMLVRILFLSVMLCCIYTMVLKDVMDKQWLVVSLVIRQAVETAISWGSIVCLSHSRAKGGGGVTSVKCLKFRP